MEKKCFLVVDDQPLITGALSMLLATEYPGSDVLTANTVDDARNLVSRNSSTADLLVLDLSMPGVVGTSLLEEFVREEPSLKILVLSGLTDRESMVSALTLGAAGFVPKTLDTDLLLTAIRFVLKGGVYLPSEIIEESKRRGFFLDAGAAIEERYGTAPRLTPRQLDVLQELAKGNPIKRIGTNLGLSEGTVKTHVSAIYRAFGARNRTEALIAAHRAGYKVTL
ncbi:MAG: response regulator transcription factor [Sutterellaceae bacterium]|nr:response regulator transcription factor [Sutterellaceae bacterium]MDY2869034.1 response regulator transcription factor [Mesosutterella sp.]